MSLPVCQVCVDLLSEVALKGKKAVRGVSLKPFCVHTKIDLHPGTPAVGSVELLLNTSALRAHLWPTWPPKANI